MSHSQGTWIIETIDGVQYLGPRREHQKNKLRQIVVVMEDHSEFTPEAKARSIANAERIVAAINVCDGVENENLIRSTIALEEIEWCFDMTKAPSMDTLELYSPKYPLGTIELGYLSDGGGNPKKYGEAGCWMDLYRRPLHYEPEAWRKISPPHPKNKKA